MEKETEKKVEETQEVATQEVKEAPEVNETTETVETVERTPRELLYERIRTSRPDAKYDDDEEEYYRQASSMMDAMESDSAKYNELSSKLMARFNSNPEEAEAFLDYLDGTPLPAAIRRRMGDDALTMREGDEGWEEYEKARAEREKQFADNRAALDTFLQNAKDSDDAMEAFIAETGLDEAGAQGFKDLVMAILNDMSAGKVTKDTLALLKRAVDYDKDVAGAREQGEIDGRNKKIDIEKKRMAGSGLPDAAAGGSASEEVDAKQSNTTADWLGKFKR